jgi:DNA-binding NtrC family response regulator
MCTLLCERDTEVSQSVAKALRHRGIADIQIADSAATASRLLASHQVSVAVVDFAGEQEAARLVRYLSARGAEVILYSHRQPEPDAFADLHYIFVDKSVDIETLAHLAAAQRRLVHLRARAEQASFAPPPAFPSAISPF